MIPQFFILGSPQSRPASAHTIFADGSADETFRQGVDLELSHWVPNTTPAGYKADTSTEICLKYVAQPERQDWELAINNHQDVDGILSVFVLVESELALLHRETLIQASRMGDFWDWGHEAAQRLFQGLTLEMETIAKTTEDGQAIYSHCFAWLKQALAEGKGLDTPAIDSGLAALAASDQRVDSQQIKRQVYHDRFVHYHIPSAITAETEQLKKARRTPSFNEKLSDKILLWPQTRNRQDREKIQLVSIAHAEGGTYYDLYYPGYAWAETPDAWRPPGLTLTGSTNVYLYGFPPLNQAISALNTDESASGEWQVIESLTPFTTSLKKKYPVVVSFLKAHAKTGGFKSARSQLPTSKVADYLSQAFSSH